MMQRLLETFQGFDRVAVAFSGGADSTLVLCAALEALGCDNVLAVMVTSALQSPDEAEHARAVAARLGAQFTLLTIDPLAIDAVRENRRDRCYYCKREVFAKIFVCAQAHGMETVLDGTNADDTGEYRPGLRALAELGVKSPLKAASLTKSEVRELLAACGIAESTRPAAPCLATRVPYDIELTEGLLQRIAQAERAVCALGYSFCRVRAKGDAARLEIPVEELPRAGQDAALLGAVRAAGFSEVTLDPEGYRSGRYDNESTLF